MSTRLCRCCGARFSGMSVSVPMVHICEPCLALEETGDGNVLLFPSAFIEWLKKSPCFHSLVSACGAIAVADGEV